MTAATMAGCADTHRLTIAHHAPARGQALPVEFVYNLPVINATIGGENVRLIVDLGGHDALALKKDAVERLPSVTTTARRQASFNAAGKMSIDRGLIAPELKLGDVAATDVHGRQIDLPSPLESEIDGYIGAAFLKRFCVLVDYPGQFVLYPVQGHVMDLDLTGWTSVPFDGRLRSKAGFEGRTITFGWDTGASHTVIDDDLARKLFDVSRGAVTASLVLEGRDCGPLEMRAIELRGSGVDLLLGHNFFQRHRVLFDFVDRTAYIEPDKVAEGS